MCWDIRSASDGLCVTTISVIPFGPVQRKQGVFYLLSGFRVKVSRRFIRKENLRFEDKRPGEGHPLLLPAGEFPRFVGGPVMLSPSLAEDCRRVAFRLPRFGIRWIKAGIIAFSRAVNSGRRL
ncbi:MAG: hypothetical protein MZV70_48640 [Desulfobacterales bacterium]|nr:hypothetical protein [Desulfobacterales bacterium]